MESAPALLAMARAAGARGNVPAAMRPANKPFVNKCLNIWSNRKKWNGIDIFKMQKYCIENKNQIKTSYN